MTVLCLFNTDPAQQTSGSLLHFGEFPFPLPFTDARISGGTFGFRASTSLQLREVRFHIQLDRIIAWDALEVQLLFACQFSKG